MLTTHCIAFSSCRGPVVGKSVVAAPRPAAVAGYPNSAILAHNHCHSCTVRSPLHHKLVSRFRSLLGLKR